MSTEEEQIKFPRYPTEAMPTQLVLSPKPLMKMVKFLNKQHKTHKPRKHIKKGQNDY